MNPETARVLAALDAEAEAGRPFALATIVSTRGSTYRHAGARLLVRDDGSTVGNLSGGCLEGEVSAVGTEVIADERPRLASYDLTADDEAIWGWGLGCNGAIDVLVVPSAPAEAAREALARGDATGRPYVLATVVRGAAVDAPVGGHLLITEDGDPTGSLSGEAADAVADAAGAAATARRSGLTTVALAGGNIDVVCEVVRPPLRLLVCGAGHDAVPLVASAARLGWRPIVVDDRSAFLDTERFPGAADFVRVEPKDAASAGVDDLTSIVVMSHNYLRDQDYLAAFLGTGYAYLGMLGPRQRLERLLADLAERGIAPSDDERARIHGPAGLDLGADGPAEIAWAICAEILAVDRGRDAGFLRDRAQPIHDRAVTPAG